MVALKVKILGVWLLINKNQFMSHKVDNRDTVVVFVQMNNIVFVTVNNLYFYLNYSSKVMVIGLILMKIFVDCLDDCTLLFILMYMIAYSYL